MTLYTLHDGFGSFSVTTGADRTTAAVVNEPARTYRTRYVYEYPSNAGPFKGVMTTPRKYARGENIHAIFGLAVVTSSR